ncbi:MAG: ABC transporter [Candidatus Methanoperedenaceae archaeon GB37]|nr:MAG: ABC transporter [Candidatus Methanoperedenaceae archaeon GB37]
MNMKHVLRVNNLTKTYHGKRIVDNLSLSVQSGEIVGLLGPNGAGKTTTFYMIIGIINPEKGRFIWMMKILLPSLCILEPEKG